MLALLLALSASPEELELAMISVTYGNVSLQRYHMHAPPRLRLYFILTPELGPLRTAVSAMSWPCSTCSRRK